MEPKKYYAETIEDVVSVMDGIIESCFAARSRLGFFTALYRATTIVVKERCDVGNFFENSERMRRLDTIFANRYFEAYEAYMNQSKPTDSWGVSFEMGENPNLMILQHLLMGMNAHISLDLGIATAIIAREEGGLTPSIERDFLRLNNILSSLIDVVQSEVGVVSPLLKYLDWMGGPFDERVTSILINEAREQAWKFSQELVALPDAEWDAAIAKRDAVVSAFSRNTIASLGFPIGFFVRFVRLRESRDSIKILQILSHDDWSTIIRNRVYKVLRHAKELGLDLSDKDTQIMKIPKELRSS